MLKRLFHMFLFITASMVIIIALCSPSFLFHGAYQRELRNLAVLQKIAPQRLFITSWRNIKSSYIDPTMNHQDWNKWKYRYLKYIKTDEDVRLAVNTMLASLNDDYSEFYDSEKYELQEKYIQDNADSTMPSLSKQPSTTATLKLNTIAGMVHSVEVTSGSQVYENPQKGDIILSIDNYPMNGMEMNSAVRLIRGISNFSKVELLRKNQKLTYSIVRGSMGISKVDSRLLKDNIVYISVFSLMGVKSPDLFRKLAKDDNKVKGYIIDLRGNVGGLFLNAVYIADVFLNNGEIVIIEYRDGKKVPINAQFKKVPKKPVVILINRQTASSSEIIAGALRSNNRAVLVGEPTFGKNIIQQIISLPNMTCINLSTARFLFNNNVADEHGVIHPDYTVPITISDILNGNDTQLQKAIEIINSYK